MATLSEGDDLREAARGGRFTRAASRNQRSESERMIAKDASVVLDKLRCPVSGEGLQLRGEELVSESGANRYRVGPRGIPLFAEEFCSEAGRAQQEHYDKVAAAYLENLTYPHTDEYMAYLDRVFLRVLELAPDGSLGESAEICCGRGEAFVLLRDRMTTGVGVDISTSMLEAAVDDFTESRFSFVQGDATMLPIEDEQFDNVFMFGGIHHVSNREKLFSEIARVLRPGGCFYWREPVSDFFLWRWIRAVVYKLAPALDAETERPLLFSETEPPLRKAGLELEAWDTYGFLGFCFFMNSDVLVFNRLFRYLPGIRALTRLVTKVDDLTVKLPGLKRAGLQVVGRARKPRQ